jgi:dTDP-L-rhamnose 4-epimerase
VFEDGRQRRDFIHVHDVAAANVPALEGGRAGDLTPYNVATGDPHTIGDLADALSKAAGGPEPVVTGEFRLGDVRHITASPARATAGLGFRAAIPFPDGLSLPAADGSRSGSPGSR